MPVPPRRSRVLRGELRGPGAHLPRGTRRGGGEAGWALGGCHNLEERKVLRAARSEEFSRRWYSAARSCEINTELKGCIELSLR